MLQIPGSICEAGNPTSRRRFLSIGSLALGGLSLPRILQAEEQAGVKNNGKGVIMVFLPGGPSHLDMFDLKPDAPEEIRGEFRPIQTNVPGIQISELMPRMAAMMDKFIPVRSLIGAINDHNVHQCVTGWDSHAEQTGSKEVPGYPSGGWPSLGAVISKELGPLPSGIPSTVDFSPDYYDARFVNSTRLGTGGFLGNGHAGFEVSSIHHDNFGQFWDSIGSGINYSPPLYFFLNWIWQLFLPLSLNALRVESLLWILGGTVLVYLTLRKQLGSVAALIGVGGVFLQSSLLFGQSKFALWLIFLLLMEFVQFAFHQQGCLHLLSQSP